MVDATSNYNQSRGLAHVGAGGLRHNLDLHQIQVTRAFVIPQMHSASVKILDDFVLETSTNYRFCQI